MGKWTPGYTDDLLTSKLKTIISTAIDKAKHERNPDNAPAITYENVVADLSENDAFTIAVVDVLVKELTERRARPGPLEQNLMIAERSALALQAIVDQAAVYGDYRAFRSPSRRPSGDVFHRAHPSSLDWDHFARIEIDHDVLDEEELLPGSGIFPDRFPPPRPVEEPISPRIEAALPVETTPAVWPAGSGPVALHRHPSIRLRPPSSRAVDFNEFTSRRRSSVRLSLQEGSSSQAPSNASDGPESNRVDDSEDTGHRRNRHRPLSSPLTAGYTLHHRLRRGGVRPPEFLSRGVNASSIPSSSSHPPSAGRSNTEPGAPVSALLSGPGIDFYPPWSEWAVVEPGSSASHLPTPRSISPEEAGASAVQPQAQATENSATQATQITQAETS